MLYLVLGVVLALQCVVHSVPSSQDQPLSYKATQQGDIMASLEDKFKAFCSQEGKTEQDVFEALQVQHLVPPEVKKVVVEHIIPDRKPSQQESATVQRRKLRLFSGTKPTPSGEVNFSTWRVAAKQIVDDEDLSERNKRRSIMDSLMIPALNLVKNVPSSTDANTILAKLVKVYGSTKSAEDMMYDFFELCQLTNESASEYLEKLYNELTCIVDETPPEVMDYVTNANEQLLSQFIRGCWDEDIIMRLKLEERKTKRQYPDYAILYEEIKREELKKEQKKKRMDQTLKGGKKTQQHTSTIAEDNTPTIEFHQYKSHMDQKYEEMSRKISTLEEGQKAMCDQLNGISHQLQNLQSFTQPQSSAPPSTTYRTSQPSIQPSRLTSTPYKSSQNYTNAPKYSRFCYKCGIDNHHSQRCRNTPNPTLVAQKFAKRWSETDTPQQQQTPPQQQQYQQQPWHEGQQWQQHSQQQLWQQHQPHLNS